MKINFRYKIQTCNVFDSTVEFTIFAWHKAEHHLKLLLIFAILSTFSEEVLLDHLVIRIALLNMTIAIARSVDIEPKLLASIVEMLTKFHSLTIFTTSWNSKVAT